MPRKRAARSSETFTVDLPEPLPVERRGDAWWLPTDRGDLRLSNLDKVFWPEEGYTKGDLLSYYWNASRWIVPHLAGRPLTMKRMPDGISGPFFYEKSVPSETPTWVNRCLVPRDDAGDRAIDYMTVDDTASLLFAANLGCIEMHPLHSRCASVTTPDYLFFDLDPFEPITFDDVIAVALHVRAALETLGLASFPKTSGATGMQIFVPIEPGWTYAQVRDFVGAVGRMIGRADPDRVTMRWKISERTGKVFIDHNMNREGANIASVYSVRPEAGATVSTPLTWDEVEPGLHPSAFTIATIWDRLSARGDLFEPVRTQPQDLTAALEALGLEGARQGSSAPRTSEEVIAGSRDPDLAEYLRKRDFEGTPEPAPAAGSGTATGRSFVIHKHRATRLHYDVRLEHDGAMPSWAVPRGLPIERGDRRLAVRTEDHPIEYASFEGTIPEGHYGAGEVRIFDDGEYEPIEWGPDKVSFRLMGRRYPGLEFHFVRTRTDWLAFLASHQEAPLIPVPPRFEPMLAEGGHRPFDDPSWWFEPKFDGIRAMTYLSTDQTRLVTRTGRDVSDAYPELRMVHELVNQVNAVIDAELVAFDESGRHSFEALQQRMHLRNEREIQRIASRSPVALVAFDLLWLDGRDVTGLALEDRRELLETVVEEDPRLQLVTHLEGEGLRFTEVAKQLGLEGVVAKKMGSRYRPGRRSSDWRKIKLVNRQDCVILGWTPGKGAASASFGALLVGAWEDGELRWVGQVGTGFTREGAADLLDRLSPLTRPEPAIEEIRGVPGATFVAPEVVATVEYLERTRSSGKFRAPSFKGIRDDVAAADCVIEPSIA